MNFELLIAAHRHQLGDVRTVQSHRQVRIFHQAQIEKIIHQKIHHQNELNIL